MSRYTVVRSALMGAILLAAPHVMAQGVAEDFRLCPGEFALCAASNCTPWNALNFEPTVRRPFAATVEPITASRAAGSNQRPPSRRRNGSPFRTSSFVQRSGVVPTMRQPCQLSPTAYGTAASTSGSRRSVSYSFHGRFPGDVSRW